MEEKNIRSNIAHKQEQLNAARTALKKEFFGIDYTIDQVIEAISSWFLFPQIQQRPVIVNLWGLTGVGKSALVKQLSALLGFERKYYRFDLGEKSTNDYTVKRNLREIYHRENGFPVILCFDEFQHARTLDEKGTENEQIVSRIVWEILDSGKFQSLNDGTWISDVYELTLQLNGLLHQGVKVLNGKVTEGIATVAKEFGTLINSLDSPVKLNDKNVDFVPEQFLERIFWIGRELFEFPQDVRTELDKMNGPETIHFLKKVMEIAESPKTVDCSKALIFVVGNLDEAYGMGNNMNPDIDADILHEESLKITLSDVKRALTKRFRYEQIARLGNTHIVYPALNKESFRRIIEKELEHISERLFEQMGATIRFDSSIVDLVYEEGVFPTQGARPIFTSISQLVTAKVGVLTSKITECNSPVNSYLISADKEVLRMSACDAAFNRIIAEEKINRALNKLRETKPDDLQAIVAVHESGHAILAMALRGIVPTCVFSRTADLSTRGFVHFRDDEDFINRKQMVHRVAERLAGFAAEEHIYGKEYVTDGSGYDIHVATEFLSHMVKFSGMGKYKGQFMPQAIEVTKAIYDKNGKVEDDIQSIIEESYALAKEILIREHRLLVNLAISLTDSNQLNRSQIWNITKQYGSDVIKRAIEIRKDSSFYRDTLLRLKEGKSDNISITEKILTQVSLNSKK